MIAQAPSRPFRWFGLLVTAWVLFRVLAIFVGDPFDGALEAAPKIVATAKPPMCIHKRPVIEARVSQLATARTAARFRGAWEMSHRPHRAVSPVQLSARPIVASSSNRDGSGAPLVVVTASPSPPPVAAGGWSIASATKRWSASAWLLVRSDGPTPLGSGGELGGSQVGARLFYDLIEPVAITARISRPLARELGGEASLGLALRHRNVGILFERRIALDRGGRNDFSVTGYGGVSEIPLGYGVRLDGYMQGGIVGRDGFADGAARVERTITALDKVRISAGAGAWGGIQPGAKRLDVGPQIVVQLPAGGSNIRVSAEWRERVAGDAAPRSGPSLTIGLDF